MTSFSDHPDTSAALEFHSVIRNSLSIAMNGTCACSTYNIMSTMLLPMMSHVMGPTTSVISRLISCRMSPMSFPMPTMPVMRPDSSVRTTACNNMSVGLPCFVNIGKSMFDTSAPRAASSNSSWISSRRSGMTNSFTRCRPMASSFSKPVISISLSFHSWMRPSGDIQNMGALADSMSRDSSPSVCWPPMPCLVIMWSPLWVNVCPRQIAPKIAPSNPRQGTAANIKQGSGTSSGNLVTSRSSTPWISLPLNAVRSAWATSPLQLSEAKLSANGLPSASCFRQPVICSAFRFQLDTQ
mmetsp:Transcript_28833/g.82786  ORF Transcript_28833/g.82786 Transcript_28833/m.82786 type:complete len:297 (-) Transcript_28833:466-1356(-)